MNNTSIFKDKEIECLMMKLASVFAGMLASCQAEAVSWDNYEQRTKFEKGLGMALVELLGLVLTRQVQQNSACLPQFARKTLEILTTRAVKDSIFCEGPCGLCFCVHVALAAGINKITSLKPASTFLCSAAHSVISVIKKSRYISLNHLSWSEARSWASVTQDSLTSLGLECL